jgi:hypothetical protein
MPSVSEIATVVATTKQNVATKLSETILFFEEERIMCSLTYVCTVGTVVD